MPRGPLRRFNRLGISAAPRTAEIGPTEPPMGSDLPAGTVRGFTNMSRQLGKEGIRSGVTGGITQPGMMKPSGGGVARGGGVSSGTPPAEGAPAKAAPAPTPQPRVKLGTVIGAIAGGAAAAGGGAAAGGAGAAGGAKAGAAAGAKAGAAAPGVASKIGTGLAAAGKGIGTQVGASVGVTPQTFTAFRSGLSEGFGSLGKDLAARAGSRLGIDRGVIDEIAAKDLGGAGKLAARNVLSSRVNADRSTPPGGLTPLVSHDSQMATPNRVTPEGAPARRGAPGNPRFDRRRRR